MKGGARAKAWGCVRGTTRCVLAKDLSDGGVRWGVGVWGWTGIEDGEYSR
jgi:hypothetical protein